VRALRADDSAATPSISEIFRRRARSPVRHRLLIRPGRTRATSMSRARRKWCALPIRAAISRRPGPPQTIVPSLPGGGGHWTRDIAFSADGKTMFRVGRLGFECRAGDGPLPDGQLASFQASHALGAAWGPEENRADVLAFDPEGGAAKVFCRRLAQLLGPDGAARRRPRFWCVVNERDILGDDLPPDYATRVKTRRLFTAGPGTISAPTRTLATKGERPDLAAKVAVPDVLIQPHSAPLGITFYEGGQFRPEYKGDAFVALHGSWNRASETGYKVVRLIFRDGEPTGEYEDFLLGFVADDAGVWGRPVDCRSRPRRRPARHRRRRRRDLARRL